MDKINCESCHSKETNIFCHFSKEEFSELDDHKTYSTYKKGQTLFHEGNPPFGLFCINDGRIKLTKSSKEGKDSIIRIANPGEVLGHRSLFAHDYYQATATALEDCKVCFINKEYVSKLIVSNPSVAIGIIEQLTRALGDVETKVASYYQKNVRERLVDLLFEFKDKYGVEENNTTKLDIKLTRVELASMVGVATETLIRFISEFKEEGAIDQKGKLIFIKDEKKLKELGNIK
jgi:CRP-like cAMP-binding protein